MYRSWARQQGSPTRELDWRWSVALALFESKKRPNTRLADDSIREAVEFLRRISAQRTAIGRRRVRQSSLGLNEAIEASTGPAERRAILEAGILSGEPSNATGLRVGLSEHSVDYYQALFFNVRDCISARGWVSLVAIRQSRMPDTTENRRFRLLRRLAYTGGPAALNVVLSAMQLDGAGQATDPNAARQIRLMDLAETPNLSLPVLVQLREVASVMQRNAESHLAVEMAKDIDFLVLLEMQKSTPPPILDAVQESIPVPKGAA